tara:strand:+ start:760 stop:1137 length:378 start_codon:yes stop_codon:yes gene_type:complete
MPKKNDTWLIGMPKGPIGPFVWQVWVKGSNRPTRVVAFDLEHIKNQLEGKKVTKAIKEKEKKELFGNSVPLGPKGYKGSSRPADYDAGFKVLRQWIDSKGGPPEEIRKKLRELWIDYDKAPRKTK